jgi:hypothetical protein
VSCSLVARSSATARSRRRTTSLLTGCTLRERAAVVESTNRESFLRGGGTGAVRSSGMAGPAPFMPQRCAPSDAREPVRPIPHRPGWTKCSACHGTAPCDRTPLGLVACGYDWIAHG